MLLLLFNLQLFRDDSSGFDSSSGADDWMLMQGYVQLRHPSNRNFLEPEFNRTPFVFGYPKLFPYAPSEACEGGCGSAGKMRCSRCKSWYCGQLCQLGDWPRHKIVCFPPPPLEKADG